MRVKIDPKTAHDSYAAWRENQHDDLVFAVAWHVGWGRTSDGCGRGEGRNFLKPPVSHGILSVPAQERVFVVRLHTDTRIEHG